MCGMFYPQKSLKDRKNVPRQEVAKKISKSTICHDFATAPAALLDADTERTELLRKLEAMPTEKLRRLVEFADSMDIKALPCASASEQGGSAESGDK